MIQSSIARRYARALFESAGSDVERAGTEISELAQSLTDEPALRMIFTDPTASPAVRRKLLESIISSAGFHPMVANLLRLLDDRRRIADLPSIAAVYGELVDESAGRLRAEIVTAVPLAKEQTERIQAALSAATHKTVDVESRQDPALLGGVVAHVGNVVYDGSLRSQLERMRRELGGQV